MAGNCHFSLEQSQSLVSNLFMMLFTYFKIAEKLVDLSYLHSRLDMIFSERFAFSLIDMKLSHKKLIAEKKKELKHWDDFKRYFIFEYLHWKNLDSFHKRELNKSDSFQANFGRTVFVPFSSLYLKRWACTNGYSKPHQTQLAVDALERFFQNLWRPGGSTNLTPVHCSTMIRKISICLL